MAVPSGAAILQMRKGLSVGEPATRKPPAFEPLADAFEAPSLERWRALAEKTLKGAPFERLVTTTYDGLKIEPLYTAADPVAEARRAPAVDALRPWDLRTVVEHPDPARANAQALGDLENGAQSVLLRLDPSGEDGVVCTDLDDLERALKGVLLELAPVALDAGYLGPRAADWLAAVAKGAPKAPLAFHFDPLSSFAETGASPGPIQSHVISAAMTAARHAPAYAEATFFLASGRVVHEAGGSKAQELAFMASAAVAYVKAMMRAGLTAEDAFRRTVLGLTADADYFATVAKLRAARVIWSRLTGASGVNLPARIEVRGSRRMLSTLDAWTNLLRQSAAVFGGAAGGADTILLDPFTRPLGRPTDFARRQARNVQLVLMEEAGLGSVADPAGGAWFVEHLTRDLARKAWTEFQAIEAEGGLDAALERGRLADDVAKIRARRETDVAKRKTGLVGVSEFADLNGAPVAVENIDAARFAKPLEITLTGPAGRCEPLKPMRLAEPFERLRARAAAMQPAPRAYLAVIGTASDYTARVTFTGNLLSAGGVASMAGEASGYDAKTTPLAVICSSDERYAEHAAATARELKAKGCRRVYLAGKPGEVEADLGAAGVDAFLAAGDDAIAVLTAMLEAAA
jgi:methylmalonyl-CoA mutase